MNEDNIKDETELLKETGNAFMKKYKELLKLKADSLMKDSNRTKYSYNKILKKSKINKKQYGATSKLPLIKNIKNNNYNYLQYLKNTKDIKFFHSSPKKSLINFGSFYHKKDRMIDSNGTNDFQKIKPYFKMSHKFSQEHKNINKMNSNQMYLKSMIEANLTNIHRNEISKKINYHLNNSNLLDGENKESNLNKNFNSTNLIQKLPNSKYNIKYIYQNRSEEHFNIRKINIKNDDSNEKDINVIERENKDNAQSQNEIVKSENIKGFVNNLKINLKELKNSNSEQNILKSKKIIKKINIINNTKSNHNSVQKKDKNNLPTPQSNKNFFIIYPGNNSKLIEKVILTRPNWEKLHADMKKHESNLLWTPLTMQINFNYHKTIDNFHLVNHFEFQNELTNKRNTFINLLKYCELNNVDLFSFYPLTIILPLNNDNMNRTLENFKKCYFDLPNLVEDPENKNSNFLYKYYRNYFHVKSNLKLGSIQKLIIPKTHYAMKNLWLIKRINLNRGREIKVMNDLEKIILEIIQIASEQNLKYIIIQKYIEKPLLYCGRKFDIRIWVLFTNLISNNKFEAYVFKEGHLKASSETFDINSLDLFIHLTNYSVQKYNKNFSKSEIGNEISFDTFQKELDKKKNGKINFRRDIFPKIIKIIGITANIAKNKINGFNRKNCFEIFGYDFILDEDYNPFLLEINTNPGFEESSPLIEMLVPRMIDDALRLTIDKIFERKDKNKNCSQFSVNNYNDKENMWQKIKL